MLGQASYERVNINKKITYTKIFVAQHKCGGIKQAGIVMQVSGFKDLTWREEYCSLKANAKRTRQVAEVDMSTQCKVVCTLHSTDLAYSHFAVGRLIGRQFFNNKGGNNVQQVMNVSKQGALDSCDHVKQMLGWFRARKSVAIPDKLCESNALSYHVSMDT